MDPTRFDALARTLAHRLARRTLIGGILAGLLGGGTAAAAGRGCRRRCHQTRRGRVCRVICTCRVGLTACRTGGRTACVDLRTDRSHCGACGNACGGLRPCANGTCGLPPSPCRAGLDACAGTCVDTSTDPAHCGGCDRACAEGEECRDGRCGTACRAVGDACAGGGCCPQAPGSGGVACEAVEPDKGPRGCGFPLNPALNPPRCCRLVGAACDGDCECCGGLECRGGTCDCRRLGDRCTAGAQCCSGDGEGSSVACAVVRRKDGPDGGCLVPGNEPDPRFCCLGAGGRCQTSCQCCGDLGCDRGRCTPPGDLPCADFGGACGDGVACCGGIPCTDGTCGFG